MTIRRSAILSIFSALVLFVAGCGGGQAVTDEGGAEEVGATAEEIEGDPAEYIGETVGVDGQIADVFGQRSFTMEGDFLGGNLLVVVPQDVNTSGITFNEGDDVQVIGTVREYVATDIDEEFGLNLGQEIEYEESEPVVIANSVSTGVLEETE